MARKNRLANSITIFLLLGAFVGVVSGLLINTIFSRTPIERVEARVMLFRVPGEGTYHAARDYVSLAISRPGFFDEFATAYGIDSNDKARISRELNVTAGDASSQSAELRLRGGDEKVLATTLDNLAIYLTESLRTIDASAKDLLLADLEEELAGVRAENLNLLDSRGNSPQLSDELKKQVRLSAVLASRRKELELSLRYFLKPLRKADEDAIHQQLKTVIEAQRQLETRTINVADTANENYRLANAIAHNEAIQQAFAQTKQRLVIEFNKDTPLRVASRTKLIPLAVETPSLARMIAICTFIGAIIGGILWSILQTRNSKLTGVYIEKRLGVPVAAVISQQLSNAVSENGLPLAQVDRQSEGLAGIRSLNIATRFLSKQTKQHSLVVFTEIGDANYIGHVIVNLALEIARHKGRVLIIENSVGVSQLSNLCERGVTQGWVSMLNTETTFRGNSSNNAISYVREQDQMIKIEDMAAFDSVLIHAANPKEAKNRLAIYAKGLGLVLCSATTPISKIRKAVGRSLGKKLHGIVLCGQL